MGRDFEDHCWKDIVDEEIIEIYVYSLGSWRVRAMGFWKVPPVNPA
jgi:hypothetical protein